MNAKKLKADFPFFGKKGAPKEYIYLDNAATTHKPQIVLDAILDFYKNYNSNIHRGIYDLSEQATKKYEDSRANVAKFLNANDSSEIIFTPGTTAGINFVADAWGRRNLKAGDEILITDAEHHSNFLPWQRLAKDLNLTLKYIPIDPTTYSVGCLNPEHYNNDDEFDLELEVNNKSCSKPGCNYLESLLTPNVKIVAISAYSNFLGPIWDLKSGELERFISKAKKLGIKVLIDAAQYASHFKVDLKKLNPDFFVFSAHKMLGPTGVGVLYINKNLHEKLEPYQVGGAMVYSASKSGSIWKKAPYKFEAGTPAIAEVIGLSAAIDYLSEFNNSEIINYESGLISQLINGLENIEKLTIYGNTDRLKKYGHLVSFNIDGIHPHDLAAYLDKRAIALRAGHHCAQPIANSLGVESTLRASVYLYNTPEDIEILLKQLQEAASLLSDI